jgi:predicted transcriptional regulator
MASAAASQPLSLRLGADGRRALEDIARKRGITRAEAARQAIAETAERERRRSGLAAEVARIANDPEDRVERERVAAEMDAVAADWPSE